MTKPFILASKTALTLMAHSYVHATMAIVLPVMDLAAMVCGL